MMSIIAVALVLVSLVSSPSEARPRADGGYSSSDRSLEFIEILKDDRVYPSAYGAYSFDTETGNGISWSESGDGTGPEGAVETSGSYSFTHPDGSEFYLSYVADENGFQPESDALPVAPEFPHPIPQFVLDQIAKAERERLEGGGSSEGEYSYN